MACVIRVYFINKIFTIDMSKNKCASIGTGTNDTVNLQAEGLREEHIKFEISNDICEIKAKKLLYREGSRISHENVNVGFTYEIDTNPQIYIAIHPKQEDGDMVVDLNENDEITIGRNSDNSIALSNMRTSSKHCIITNVGNSFIIKDLNSRNGTFVNGIKVSSKTLNEGDIINISIYQIKFENNRIFFFNVGDDIQFNIPTLKKDTDDIETEYRTDTLSLFGENENKEIETSGTLSLYD